jgi:hypothetical protein
MTVLLQWVVAHAWIFYVACAIGAIVYIVRALGAQRERSLALFTLERETATSQIVQFWGMVLVFFAIAAAVLVSTTYLLPKLPIAGPGTPLPTSTLRAGVEVTPGARITSSPTPDLLVQTSTPTPTVVSAPPPTAPPPETIEIPTLSPTDTPEPSISGEVYVRFGDFAELIGYSLPAAEVSAAQVLPLTLYWGALEGTSPVNYTVFTHLLSEDGRLIAQHDGTPASGTRPTTTWTAGETISDPHPMTFYDAGFTGPARIAVGLYDPTNGRVPAESGSDQVILPITISVVP